MEGRCSLPRTGEPTASLGLHLRIRKPGAATAARGGPHAAPGDAEGERQLRGLCPQDLRPRRGEGRPLPGGPCAGAEGGPRRREASQGRTPSPEAPHGGVAGPHPPKPPGGVLSASSACRGAGAPGLWQNHPGLCLRLVAPPPKRPFLSLVRARAHPGWSHLSPRLNHNCKDLLLRSGAV